MLMVTVALRGPQSAALPADVLDILWFVASFERGVEHLHADSPEVGGIGHLTFFVKGPTREKAVALARGITRRALVDSPALTGWHVVPMPGQP
ncbi:hypothetical protein [Streptomyces sp. WZ.A104]|uniref:hypothetical protein n=1 Tax=Streptomyces sp. WZ.A104 TaxID=2023771 RepID=UPI00211C82A8|nr:hypothetical protein [Streptomyces sp. WZ.A104]